MFFDVVIKVLNFIVSVIRVELPNITLPLSFVSADSWMFHVRAVILLSIFLFYSFYISFSVMIYED